MKKTFFVGLVAVVLLHAACSFSTPSILLTKTERIYSYNSQGMLTERLAAFILLADPDGRNDYKMLLLREEATGLEWSLDRENAVFLQEKDEVKTIQWVGSNKFKYPRHFFPAGRYTLTALDLSGKKTEASFLLQEAPPVSAMPFSFSLEQGRWKLHILDGTACTTYSLILLSADLQPLAVHKLKPDDSGVQDGDIQAFKKQMPDARYIQGFGEDEYTGIGFLGPPISLAGVPGE